MRLRSWAATVTAVTIAGFVLGSPTSANAAPDVKKPPAGADVFGHDKVWKFHLELTAREYDAMQPAAGGGFGFPGGGFPKGPDPPKVEPKAGEVKRETHRGVFGTPAPDLRKFVEKRSESIAAQLSGKSKGFTPTGFGFGGPPPRPLPGDVLPPAKRPDHASDDRRAEEGTRGLAEGSGRKTR